MPIYEFVCRSCDAGFEELTFVGAPSPQCPQCGASDVRRQLSVFAAGRSASDAGARSGGCACGGACACGA